jgi:(p)ppGpp synthase/HD superfamily hydrolase
MAYMLSGKAPSGAEHFKIMQENRDKLAKELGEDTLDRLVEEAIYDKFGIRLIASSEDNCYVLRDWFRQHFYIVRQIDYIRGPPGPKKNGYQSIHMTIMGLPTDPFTQHDSIKIPVDVQIRTAEMDKEAETGSAAWGGYKKRRDLINHQFLLAVTAFRHYLFGV